MTQMNFPKELTVDVLSTLNWATADETYTPRKFLHIREVADIQTAYSCSVRRASIGVVWLGTAQNKALKA